MSSNEPEPNSSAHAAKKPGSQSVLAPACVMRLVSTTSAKDLVTPITMERKYPQIQPTDNTTEENLPIFQKASEVVEKSKPSPFQVTAIPEAVLSFASSAQNAVAKTLAHTADVTHMASPSGLHMTKSKSATNMETLFNYKFEMPSAAKVLEQSEEEDGNCLPMTDDELAGIATCIERLEISTPQKQKKQRRYFVHLGSLPLDLQQQAVEFYMIKLARIKESIHEIQLHLSHIISLINYVKQSDIPLDEHQEELYQMWSSWKETIFKNVEQDAGQIESHTLNQLMNVLHQVLDTLSLLSFSIQGLCDDFKRKLGQIVQSVRELKVTLKKAHSLHDLSSNFLALVQKESNKILLFQEQIREYVAEDKPLSLIMGPFIPSSQGSQQAEKASEKIPED